MEKGRRTKTGHGKALDNKSLDNMVHKGDMEKGRRTRPSKERGGLKQGHGKGEEDKDNKGQGGHPGYPSQFFHFFLFCFNLFNYV